MDEVLQFSQNEISQMVKESHFHDEMIKIIANELFSNSFNVTRIAFLMAFVKMWIDDYPETKNEIYEDFFNALYLHLKFKKKIMDTLTICQYACSDPQIRKTFGGVFPSDSLPRRIGKFTTFVINLDAHSLPGSHWIAVQFNPTKKNVNVFDSYGLPPTDKNILSFLKRNAHAIYYNDQCFQENFTKTCGHFSLYFLYKSVRFLKIDDLKENKKKQNESFVTMFIRQNFKPSACCQFNYDGKRQKCISFLNMLSARKH